VKLRVCLAFSIAASTGCVVIANLQDYTSSSDGGPSDPPVAASCKELLAADPATAGHNGLYAIDPDGPGPNAQVTVFCEMSLDRGGWTLVGRSASAAPFGWSSSTGTPADMTVPYSLGVTALGLAFSQILIADADGKSLGAATRAYRVSVPMPFLAPFANAGTQTSGVVTVFGDCSPPGGPEMLRWAGYTSLTDDFFFRDVDGTGQKRGLRATGFDLAYPDCARGGSLDGHPGLIFVR
jgi:hypothetical protein